MPPVAYGLAGVIVVLVAAIGVVLLTDDDGSSPEPNTETVGGEGGLTKEDGTPDGSTDRPAGDYVFTEDPILPDLPPPDMDGDAEPPSFGPGEDDPEGRETALVYGDLELTGVLEVEPVEQEHVDIPVHLEAGSDLVMFPVDENAPEEWFGTMDGMYLYIELYTPDGEVRQGIATGEEDMIVGMELVEESALHQTGTYVFRVIHLAGRTDPFVLRLFQ